MKGFHHHPDGRIYVRVESGVYSASLEQFRADLVQLGVSPYDDLPEGCIERRFDGEQHVVLTENSQMDGGPWDAGGQYLLHSGELLALQEERERPTPTFDQVKAQKSAEINRARMIANLASFPYAGKLIACDLLSRSDIDGVAMYVALNGTLPPSFPGAWKAIDNTYVPMPDAKTFKEMFAAMAAAGIANFTSAQELKAQLGAMSTEEDVAALKVTITQG